MSFHVVSLAASLHTENEYLSFVVSSCREDALMISSGKKMVTNCLNDPQGYEKNDLRRGLLSLC